MRPAASPLPLREGPGEGWRRALTRSAFALTLFLASPAAAAEPVWREVPWPWPRDAWPAGRAFRCEGDACGPRLDLYVRAKLGFCNCGAGVTDDAEVDGTSDLDMVSARFAPTAPGQFVTLAGLHGHTRPYTIANTRAAGFALASTCDLLVVLALGPNAPTPAARDAIASWTDTPEIRSWINRLLGRP